MIYYHVVAGGWDGGDLNSWSIREHRGEVTDADWKWDEAPVGYDGDLVSLHDEYDAAADFLAADLDGNGEILIVEPDETVEMRVNGEGFAAARWTIPARCVWRPEQPEVTP